MNTEQDEALKFFADGIRKRLGNHLCRLILFGSRARGEADDDSDYDCLVVVDRVTHRVKNAIDDLAGEALYRFDAVFSAFPISETSQRERRYSPFLINTAKEGIPL